MTTNTWETYHHEIHQFINRRINNPMDAEDVLQEVMVKALTKYYQLTDATRFRGWLYQIARHSIIDYYRTHQHNALPLDEIALLVDMPIEGKDERAALIACMVSLVETLPEKYRTALVAAEFYEVPQHLLSQQLGLSYSGTKSRVQRGREKLRELLETLCIVEMNQYQQTGCTPKLGECDC